MKITCFDTYRNEYQIEESEFVERPAVYGLLVENDAVLLAKDAWGKRWGLPGGGIDQGESKEEALIREFREETGLEIEVQKEIYSDISYFVPEGEPHPWKTLRYIYTVSSVGGVLEERGNGIDVIAASYIKLLDIENIELQSGNTHLLRRLLLNAGFTR